MAECDEAPIQELIERSLGSSFEAEKEVGNPASIAAWDAIGTLARAEAICALARRRDLACVGQLVRDLGDLGAWDDWACHIEAAEWLLGCEPDDERSPEELRNELVRMYPSL